MSCAAVLSGLVNRPTLRTETLDRIYRKQLRWLDLGELCLYILVGLVAAGVTWLEHVRIQWILPHEAEVWCSVGILLVVVADLAMQITVYIPRLRRVQEADDSLT